MQEGESSCGQPGEAPTSNGIKCWIKDADMERAVILQVEGILLSPQLGWEPHSYIPGSATEQASAVEAKAKCFVVDNVCQESSNKKPKFYNSSVGHILGPELHK